MGIINTNTVVIFIIMIVALYLIYLFFFKKKVGAAELQWRNFVKPKLMEIDEMYEKYVSKGKKPSIFEKKDVKNIFKECKDLYNEYYNICKNRNVKPNMAKEDFDNYIDNVENPLLNENELLDKELDRAKFFYDEQYNKFCISLEDLYNTKKSNEHIIDEIENLINTISSQPKSFEIEINEIKAQKLQLTKRIKSKFIINHLFNFQTILPFF